MLISLHPSIFLTSLCIHLFYMWHSLGMEFAGNEVLKPKSMHLLQVLYNTKLDH